jgi:hypothetical protein
VTLATAARAAVNVTDERVMIAVLGSMAIVVGIAILRLWRG